MKGDEKVIEYCRQVGDIPSANIFEELMNDEEEHIDFIETQLDLMDTIGVQNYGQLNAQSSDEAEAH